MPDIPPYAQLKARATELGIRSVGVKGLDLATAIEAEQARLAAVDPMAAAAVAGTPADDDPAAVASAQAAGEIPAEGPKRVGKIVPIERQDAIRWWCPICDFAMPPYMKGCAKCGAARRGEAVIPA